MTAVPALISATVEMKAGPEAVWKVVSDFARMPEFSPELRKAFVVGKPGVGAHIIGINRRKAVLWPTTSKVVRWEPGRAVAWRTRESGATWIYELERTATGTSVTGRRTLPKYTLGTSLLGPVIGGAGGHDVELANGIRTTLERIRSTVEQSGIY
jgi:Polyketide cyclase / dehydrase and lipid transport